MPRSLTLYAVLFLLLLFAVAVLAWIALNLNAVALPQRARLFALLLLAFLLFESALFSLPIVLARRQARRDADLASALRDRRALVPGAHELAGPLNELLRDLGSAENRSAALAQQVNREERLAELGRFASGLAHEIRNPITNVIGYAQLVLEKRQEDETLVADLKTIITEARRCEAITDSILSFSRAPRLSREPVALADLLPPAPGLRLDLSVKENAGTLVADRVLLSRVIANLVSNAAEAGAKRLAITAERRGASLRWCFADDGPGIPVSLRESLFEPFATAKRGGLGLGLAIARGIVMAHGGTLTARNRAEGGAEFELELPVK